MWNEEYYGSEEQAFWEGPGCPVCGGPPAHLGTLGKLEHWRCRGCGMDHSTERYTEVSA